LSFATYLRYASEWKERRFELPLDFAAILIAVLLLKVLPERSSLVRAPSWGLAVAAIAAVQLLWLPIQTTYLATEPLFQYEVRLGDSIAAVYNEPAYRGGVLNMPGDEPAILYVLARNGGLSGDRVTSQFYDPFHYLPSRYRYADHKAVVGTLLHCWFWNTRTRLILISPPGPLSQSVADYKAFIADNPQWFTSAGPDLGNGWSLFATQVSPPVGDECRQAAGAAGV
jgi:hypothetical protein